MKLISREKDPFNGIITEYYAQADGNVFVRKLQDVTSIIEQNKILLNNFSELKNKHWKNIRQEASIPPQLAEQWAKEAGVRMFSEEFNQLVKRKLNSSEYKYLRTSPGKL